MGMFVQGFWFSAKSVRDGSIEAAHVMGVLWACIIVTTNFQVCIPHLITLGKGKFASVLIAHVEAPTPAPRMDPWQGDPVSRTPFTTNTKEEQF